MKKEKFTLLPPDGLYIGPYKLVLQSVGNKPHNIARILFGTRLTVEGWRPPKPEPFTVDSQVFNQDGISVTLEAIDPDTDVVVLNVETSDDITVVRNER